MMIKREKFWMMINLRLGLTYVGFLYFLYLTTKKILRWILSKMGAITANCWKKVKLDSSHFFDILFASPLYVEQCIPCPSFWEVSSSITVLKESYSTGASKTARTELVNFRWKNYPWWPKPKCSLRRSLSHISSQKLKSCLAIFAEYKRPLSMQNVARIHPWTNFRWKIQKKLKGNKKAHPSKRVLKISRKTHQISLNTITYSRCSSRSFIYLFFAS